MKAIVRDVPDSFVHCVTDAPDGHTIDLALARRQHAQYIEALESLGIDIVRLPADERFPDCVFTEDSAVVVGDDVIACNMRDSPGRDGEQGPVLDALADKRIHRIQAPASIDGGDVLRWQDDIFVGQSRRTNAAAVEQMRAALPDHRIHPVPVHDTLHLKTCATIAGGRLLLVADGHVDTALLPELPVFTVPVEERHGANCMNIGGAVMLPDDCPATARRVRDEGLDVVTVPMSEFRKADGSLTCLSIRV